MLIQFRGTHLQQVFALKQGLTADMAVLGQQAQDRHHGLGFAGTRFTNQAQRITGFNREASDD